MFDNVIDFLLNKRSGMLFFDFQLSEIFFLLFWLIIIIIIIIAVLKEALKLKLSNKYYTIFAIIAVVLMGLHFFFK